jgi:protein TonB
VKLAQPLPRRIRAETPPVRAARAAPKGDLRPPRLRADLSPAARYPEAARRNGLEGTVVLLVGIGADGAVERVEVAESSGHEELDRAAAEAAEGWHFEPARLDGVAVAHEARVPVEFRLTDA